MFAIVAVIERQYNNYFLLEMTDQVVEETNTARLHNMDAEEIMGMFSAGKERAKAARVDYLSAKMRAKKKQVLSWLEGKYQNDKQNIINWASKWSTKKRVASRLRDEQVQQEISKRLVSRKQKKVEKQRKDLQKQIKGMDIVR